MFGVGLILCWVLVVWCGFWCNFSVNIYLAEEEIAGCLTLIVIWLSMLCVSFSSCLGVIVILAHRSGFQLF